MNDLSAEKLETSSAIRRALNRLELADLLFGLLSDLLAAAAGTLFARFAASLRCDFDATRAALLLP